MKRRCPHCGAQEAFCGKFRTGRCSDPQARSETLLAIRALGDAALKSRSYGR